MKKIIKNPIFTFVLGIVLTSGIVVTASQIFAKDIYFEPQEGWTLEENTVEAAIDDLYSKSNEKIIFLTANSTNNLVWYYSTELGKILWWSSAQKYGEIVVSNNFNLENQLLIKNYSATWNNQTFEFIVCK